MSDTSKVLVDESEVPLDGSDTSGDDAVITSPFDTSKIRVETKNTQMDALIKRIKNSEIDLAPDFQRQAGIWSDTAKSRLIESMLIKIPLPAFYMDATDDDNWLVVDGLQRLTTIKRFVVDESLALSGLEFLTDHNGKTFHQLPRSFQRRIEETDIVLFLIQPGTPQDVKFDIFRRINTGGEPLSAQEIRHALNQGQITHFLQTLASASVFSKATDSGVSAKRMDDRECVLRFLAFIFFPPRSYTSDNFDQFLNSAMAHGNTISVQQLKELTDMFSRAMQCMYDIFGNDAFRKRYEKNGYRYPINKALFEAWSVSVGLLSAEQQCTLVLRKEDLKSRFIRLMNDDKEFETAISQGTGAAAKVRYRFAQVARIIQETLH